MSLAGKYQSKSAVNSTYILYGILMASCFIGSYSGYCRIKSWKVRIEWWGTGIECKKCEVTRCCHSCRMKKFILHVTQEMTKAHVCGDEQRLLVRTLILAWKAEESFRDLWKVSGRYPCDGRRADYGRRSCSETGTTIESMNSFARMKPMHLQKRRFNYCWYKWGNLWEHWQSWFWLAMKKTISSPW